MVYRRTERIEERLQDKRDRILQAVRKVVGEVGFRSAQVMLFAEALALNAQHEVSVVAAVAEVKGSAGSRLANVVRVFAERAVRARRLAWAMLAEPAEPEVDAARLIYRRAFAAVFEKLIRD